MTEQRWSRVKDILGTALDLHRDGRSAYLEDACGGDSDLREEVEALLASSDQADDFIEQPALSLSSLPHEADTDNLIGTKLANYRIVQLIGEGGMGAVYRAIRDEGDFTVQFAIKVVKRGMDSQAILRRFREERRILARLDHPNIAKLLDGGITPDGRPYFVMEFLEGTPIDVYCNKHELPLRTRLELFLDACDAVEYSHRNLVIHRDLKASNILVSTNGVPKLLDFGIAKLTDRNATSSGEITSHAERLLTPDYASPEQIRGEAMTTSTDVYSLGVLLFELLTGRRPFHLLGLSRYDMISVLTTEDPPKPSSIPEVPHSRQLRGDLDTIVLKAMHRDAERRYSSVRQLADDLRNHIAGRPVNAQPDRFFYRSWKFLARNRKAVIAGAVTSLLIFGLAIAFAWQRGVAEAKNKEAAKRFGDLRELANSFLIDLDGELAKLPGSTPAREILANKVLRYLDMLARDDIKDKSLQRELATAYERLGDVQGGPKSSNLGNSAAALESYGKAWKILDKLVVEDPQNDRLALALAEGYGKLSDLLSLMGDNRAALEQANKALGVREKMLAGDPENRPAQRALAATLQDVAGLLERTGEYSTSFQHRRKALSILEDLRVSGYADSNLRLALALGHKRLGRSLARQKRYPEAILCFDRAMKIEKEEAESGSSRLVARTNLAFTYDDKGVALTAMRDYYPAFASLSEALRLRTALATADPKDVRAASLLAATHLHIGIARMKSGDAARALPYLRSSLASREDLSARDPRNSGAKAEVAEAMAAVGDALARTGKRPEATKWYEQASLIYIDLKTRGNLTAEYANEPRRLAAALGKP